MPTIGSFGPAAARRAAWIDGRLVWIDDSPIGDAFRRLAREVVRPDVDRDERDAGGHT
jgi:hypothetical protein